MIFKKNEIEIIKLLVSSSQYLTSYDIAAATGMNRRLVRDEMLNVKNALTSLGYELISKTSKGYIIKNKSSHTLSQLEKIIEDAERHRESIFPTLPNERQDYIIRRLIETNDYIKIDDLADELLISRSTISSDLKKARQQICQKYQLSFKQKPNYGICITGAEVNKRKPLCDYLFTKLNESEMFYDYLHSFITQKDSLEYGIIKILHKNQIEISDISLCDFLLSLSVSISRIIADRVLTSSPDLSYIEGRKEFDVAGEIAQFIESHVDCHFNEFEINQIAIQLICKRSSTGLVTNQIPGIEKMFQDVLKEIKEKTLISFENDEFFHRVFSLCIESVILCATYNEKIRHPLYNEIKMSYPLAYELAEIAASVIEKEIHQPLSMSSLAFFATLFNTAIYNQKPEKMKVLLLSGLGGKTGRVNSQIILDRFSHQLDIVHYTQYHRLPDEDLQKYDFIISSIPIHADLSIPHINISALADQDDLDKIESYLSYNIYKLRLETLFQPLFYKNHLKMKTFKSIINEFYKTLKLEYPSLRSLKNNNIINDIDDFATFSYKIGILKLHKPLNSNNLIMVEVLENPIIYNKQDIQIIILFSSPDHNHYIYNSLTDIFQQLTSHPEDIDNFLKQPHYPDFIKLLQKYQ